MWKTKAAVRRSDGIIGLMRISLGELAFGALFTALLSVIWWLTRQGFLGGGQALFVEAAVLGFFATLIFIVFGILSEQPFAPAFALGASLLSAWVLLLEGSAMGIAAVVGAFVLSFTAWIRMRQQRSLLLNPSFSSAAHAGLGLWFLAMAVTLALGAYLALPDQEVLIKKIPEVIVSASLPFVEKPLQQFGNIDLNARVDDFIAQTQDVKDKKKIATAREQFANQIGLPLTGDKRIRDVIQDLLERQVRTLFSVFGKYIVVGFVVVFSVFSQTLSAPSLWVLMLLGPVVLKFLRGVGFAEEEQQTVVRSMLRWRRTKASEASKAR